MFESAVFTSHYAQTAAAPPHTFSSELAYMQRAVTSCSKVAGFLALLRMRTR